jgi:hypothetical protein
VDLFLLGAFAMGCMLASAAFLRFWLRTRDRLFLWFALSFLLEAINRAAFAASDLPDDASYYYGVRLVSYLMLLWAVVEKNWIRTGR